jgi:hypothetical protein
LEDDEPNGLAVDSASIVYVAGSFRDTVDFNPGAGTESRTSQGMDDAYLGTFTSAGVFDWVKTWGGTGTDMTLSICASPTLSEVWVCGIFSDTVDFDPGAPVDNRTSGGSYDSFVCGYTGAGVRNFTETWGGAENDCAIDIAYHSASDKVVVTGYFRDVVDFDPGASTTERSSNGLQDVYVSCLAADGAFDWVDTWGGSSIDIGEGVAVSGGIAAPIYVGGVFNDVVDFDPQDGIDGHTSNGSYDAFLSRFPSDGVW